MTKEQCYTQMLSVLEYIDENDDGVGIALGYKADEMVKDAIKNAKQANGVEQGISNCNIPLVMPLLLRWQRYRFQKALSAFLKDMCNKMKSNKA